MHKFLTSALGAVLVLAGIVTPGGTADAANFTDTSFGISIDIDDSLTKQPLWRDIQYFNSQDRTASLMIKRIYDLSVVEFLDELRDVGYTNHRDSVILNITGEPVEADVESGRGLLIPVKGWIRGQPVRGMVGAYSGHDGQGFLVVGSAKPGYRDAWSARMKAMFESVRIIDFDWKAMVEGWKNRLEGKKLQHKQANVSGFIPGVPFESEAVRDDFYLCSDGTVIRKYASVGQYAGQDMAVYGESVNESRGTWSVIVSNGAPHLSVRDGPEQRLRLEVEGSNFLLNGQPYAILANDLCK